MNISIRLFFSVVCLAIVTLPGCRGTETITITPAFDEQVWFNRFRVGIWPDYFEGVQFPKDEESLNQYFRQMTPTIGTTDFDVYSDAYAALFDKVGPAVFVTHSQGGPVGTYAGMAQVYNGMHQWIKDNGYEGTGTSYEHYYSGPWFPEEESLTKVVMPLKN